MGPGRQTHIGFTMHDRQAPTRAQMQTMAETAFAELPAQFRDQMGDVVLQKCGAWLMGSVGAAQDRDIVGTFGPWEKKLRQSGR